MDIGTLLHMCVFFLVATAGVSELMNLFYDGDWIFESSCTDRETGTTSTQDYGYLIMSQKRKAIATWTIVDDVKNNVDRWQLGAVANFTGPVTDK